MEEVIKNLTEISALIDRLYIDVCLGKKDTKIILRFLNNICVEVGKEN